MTPPERATRRSVQATYERIGGHFAQTRTHPWPAVERFLEGRPIRSVGLDCGCGNGRHLPVLGQRVERVLAVDLSPTLIGEAQEGVETSFEPILGEASRLPVPDSCVDTALYIATVHHLPTRGDRVDSLTELGRVLAPDGQALVSAWSVTHDRFDAEAGHDRSVEWTLPDGETVDRFYHIYDPAEFERDLRASGAALERTFTEAGNCFAVLGAGEE